MAATLSDSRPVRIGAVYLARCSEGIDAFKRFADSYRRHPAGLEHELIVIYKGFGERRSFEEARQIFGDLPHIGIEVDDRYYDIGSYLLAEPARRPFASDVLQYPHRARRTQLARTCRSARNARWRRYRGSDGFV